MSPVDLYPSVKVPPRIETHFLGFDVAHRNLTVSLIVAIILFVSLHSEYSGKKYLVNQKNAFFIYVFPLFTFFALWWLPSVKALFIFTSMLFSFLIHYIQRPIYEAIFSRSLKALKDASAPATPVTPEPAPVKADNFHGARRK